MSDYPRVTIMIPTYNQAPLLSAAIESALAQDYPHLEVIVADDASTDETPDVVARFRDDPRLRYVRNTANVGRVANYRQALFEHATGEWALNLDGDDYLIDSCFLREAIDQVRARQGVILVVGGFRERDVHGQERERLPTRSAWRWQEGRRYFLAWDLHTVVPHLAALYHRQSAIDADFYRMGLLGEDCRSLRRLVLHGDVLLAARAVGVWRDHATNASKERPAETYIRELGMILDPYGYALGLGMDGPALVRWKRRNIAQLTASYVIDRLTHGWREDARTFLGHVRRAHPEAWPLACWLMATDSRFWVRLGLLAIGGPRLVTSAAAAWRAVRRRQRSFEWGRSQS